MVGNDPQNPVRLRDIATIEEGIDDRKTLVTGNGQPAAIVNVTRQIGGNIVTVSDQVKALAFHGSNLIPPTLHLSTVYDLAEFVAGVDGECSRRRHHRLAAGRRRPLSFSCDRRESPSPPQ